MNALKTIGWTVLATVLLLIITAVFQGEDFFMYKAFAPKYEAVLRETFEQSKAYQSGSVEELQNMQLEYARATPAQQDALASIILHRAAGYGGPLPADLQRFVDVLKEGRGL